MEKLLEMKRKNTVFVDKPIDGQRREDKAQDHVTNRNNSLSFSSYCGQCVPHLRCRSRLIARPD